VLNNNWSSLLLLIGGYQYVKDLAGRRLLHYHHLRQSSLALMEKRRALMAELEEELGGQYSKVVRIAFDVGECGFNTHLCIEKGG
jgi:hypothetical protein